MNHVQSSLPTQAHLGGIQTLHIKKESLKFASAHMTIFSDGTKEAIHGHNYTVELAVTLASPPSKEKTKTTSVPQEGLIPFASLKSPALALCQAWDEKLLLAVDSPFFTSVRKDANEWKFELCKKRYMIPTEEIVALCLENITAESLSREFCRQYLEALSENLSFDTIAEITIRIDESPGQGASYTCRPQGKLT